MPYKLCFIDCLYKERYENNRSAICAFHEKKLRDHRSASTLKFAFYYQKEFLISIFLGCGVQLVTIVRLFILKQNWEDDEYLLNKDLFLKHIMSLTLTSALKKMWLFISQNSWKRWRKANQLQNAFFYVKQTRMWL